MGGSRMGVCGVGQVSPDPLPGLKNYKWLKVYLETLEWTPWRGNLTHCILREARMDLCKILKNKNNTIFVRTPFHLLLNFLDPLIPELSPSLLF